MPVPITFTTEIRDRDSRSGAIKRKMECTTDLNVVCTTTQHVRPATIEDFVAAYGRDRCLKWLHDANDLDLRGKADGRDKKGMSSSDKRDVVLREIAVAVKAGDKSQEIHLEHIGEIDYLAREYDKRHPVSNTTPYSFPPPVWLGEEF